MANWITDDGQRATITVTGTLDGVAASRLTAQMRSLVGTGVRYVLLDLNQVEDCDPQVPAVVHRIRGELRARGGVLVTDGGAPLGIASPSLLEAFTLYQQSQSRVHA